MWLIALKGLSGCGKSTLGRALSRQQSWPLIDKDDIKDLLDGHTPEAGGLAYEILFNIVRRQLLQGLSVICDSPLTFHRGYERVRSIAQETQASLVIIECYCSDEQVWRDRINARKALQLPAHHQTDWEMFQAYRQHALNESSYSIDEPRLVIDMVRPLSEVLEEVTAWLENCR